MRALVLIAVLASTFAGCSLIPPSLDEQKRFIADGQFHARPLSRRAFLELWGPPMYEHVALTQFYMSPNGNNIPVFRLEIGERPAGWNGSILYEVGDFWAYPERGELLGFIEEDLVFREQLSTEKIHVLGRRWQFENQFKTRLESPSKNP